VIADRPYASRAPAVARNAPASAASSSHGPLRKPPAGWHRPKACLHRTMRR